MIDRRTFLLSTGATGLGLLLPGQRAVASPGVPAHPGRSAWDYLGTPRSWSLVRKGLHPIAPERVVVLTRPRQSRRQLHLLDHLGKCFHGKLSTEKIAWIVHLSGVLADHYGLPVAPWAIKLAKREALGYAPLGLVDGAALLHQFQDWNERHVPVDSTPVDWWLFLFPEGIDWQAFDDQPIFGMIAHVFESLRPGLQLPVWSMTTATALMMNGQEPDPTAWGRLARLDRISAARRVNSAVFRCLESWRRENLVADWR